MNKTAKALKKRELFILKMSNTLDDLLYFNVDRNDVLEKLRYTMECDSYLKNNTEDIDFLVASCKAIIERIDNVN